MLMDISRLELRDVLDLKLATNAIKVLQEALAFGAFSKPTEWFNNDDNFAQVMTSTIDLQHVLSAEVNKLHSHLEKTEISFRGWKHRGLSRMTLLGGCPLQNLSE